MKAPVAVVVPAFDAAGELAETLDSILAQTTPPTEICVTVDRASTDGTLAVARGFEPAVKVVPVAPTTSMHARQLAVEDTTAPLVAPCDADDVWLRSKLERQVAALEANDDLDGLFCDVTEFVSHPDEAGAPVVRRPHERIPGRVASALLIRRPALEAMGGFVADDQLAQWIAWLSGAMDGGLRFGSVDEVLVRRRLRPDSYTSRHREQTPEMLDTVLDHLTRRRANGDDRAPLDR